MGIFSWMQNKLNGSQGSKKSDSVPENYHIQKQCKEESSEWPHGLLAIGTFGNNKMNEETHHLRGNPPSPRDDHLQGLKPEEAAKIQKELSLMLQAEAAEEEGVAVGRVKDICLDHHSKSSIGNNSLTFLLRKIFDRRSGFPPAPSLRDSIPNQPRMEKTLRAILNKKIYPQSSTSTIKISARHLESTNMLRSPDNQSEKMDHKVDGGSKWVITDSEYIVLEI